MRNRNDQLKMVFCLVILLVGLLLVIVFRRNVNCGSGPIPSGDVKNQIDVSGFSCGLTTLQETTTTCARPVMSHDEVSRLRFKLERDGADAEVDVKVEDRFGNPVPGAFIHLYFNQPEGKDESKGIVEGFSDMQGRFSARRKTTYACLWKVEKDGFYEASGTLPFSNHFSAESGRKGRWTEEPLALDIILDERSGVKLLHGFIAVKDLSFPTNMWVGFDFEANDCVDPFGVGKNPHVSFFSEGSDKIAKVFRSGGVWTNRLRIASPGGGLEMHKEKPYSHMPFCHMAPDCFSSEQLVFSDIRAREGPIESNRPGNGDYIVFKTTDNSGEASDGHYGIIRQLAFWPGGLRMEYFFNPAPEDRRIDVDIHSQCDLER